MQIIHCNNERPKPKVGYSPCNRILFFTEEPISDMNVTLRCSGCKAYVNIVAKNGKVEFSAVEKPIGINDMKEPETCVERQLFQL